MTHNEINTLFYITGILGFAGGTALFIWWVRRTWKKIANTQSASVNGIAMRTLFYSMPGIIMFVVCLIPCFYFMHLLDQEEYCKDIIRFNKGIQKDDSTVQERCSCFDLDELFKEANNSSN